MFPAGSASQRSASTNRGRLVGVGVALVVIMALAAGCNDSDTETSTSGTEGASPARAVEDVVDGSAQSTPAWTRAVFTYVGPPEGSAQIEPDNGLPPFSASWRLDIEGAATLFGDPDDPMVMVSGSQTFVTMPVVLGDDGTLTGSITDMNEGTITAASSSSPGVKGPRSRSPKTTTSCSNHRAEPEQRVAPPAVRRPRR